MSWIHGGVPFEGCALSPIFQQQICKCELQYCLDKMQPLQNEISYLLLIWYIKIYPEITKFQVLFITNMEFSQLTV